MSRIPTTFPSTSSTRTASTTATSSKNSVPDAVNDLDLSTFLDLMIKELQNQDPLNPLDNKDMLAQISQLRQVGSTDKLTQTLNSVLLGQNIASATNLIGSDISAISDDGENVNGTVTRVAITDGEPKIHLDKEVKGTAHIGEGSVEKGTYSYRVLWEGDEGDLRGVELSGSNAVVAAGNNAAIEIQHLPESSGPKQVYRSDADGGEPYRLVGTIVNGSQGTFVDRLADKDRSLTEITSALWDNEVTLETRLRSYVASLKNISDIRP